MSTTAPKRLEPFTVPGGLRGTLLRIPLPDLLRELQAAEANGILALTRGGGARKALYLKGGRVVFAASNLPSDRLGEVLVREGRITPGQNADSAKAVSQGRRQGRALVEAGVLTPDELWQAVQTQVREIVFSVFHWDEGSFHFEESVLPERERITVDLDVTALIVEGLRRVDPTGAIRARYPDIHIVPERASAPPDCLFPWEQHVLSLVDGERSVIEICQESEAGEGQTLKALYAFLCTGIVRARGRKVRALDQDFVPGDSALSLLDSFNRMYRQVFGYMVREVGPIAENVLLKYLNNVREARPEILADVGFRRDGSLDEAAIERNLGRVPEDQRRSLLVDALNELLYAELLAIKRTLGADHESAIVRELRPQR